MKECKFCRCDIDKKATVCPVCKRKLNEFPLIFKILIVAFFVIAFYIYYGDYFKNIEKKQEEKKEQFLYEVEKTYKGNYNIGYYLEGKVKNDSDKEYSYVQIIFICYDKDGNQLDTALDNTNNLLPGNTWKFKAGLITTEANKVDHCDFKEITGW